MVLFSFVFGENQAEYLEKKSLGIANYIQIEENLLYYEINSVEI